MMYLVDAPIVWSVTTQYMAPPALVEPRASISRQKQADHRVAGASASTRMVVRALRPPTHEAGISWYPRWYPRFCT